MAAHPSSSRNDVVEAGASSPLPVPRHTSSLATPTDGTEPLANVAVGENVARGSAARMLRQRASAAKAASASASSFATSTSPLACSAPSFSSQHESSVGCARPLPGVASPVPSGALNDTASSVSTTSSSPAVQSLTLGSAQAHSAPHGIPAATSMALPAASHSANQADEKPRTTELFGLSGSFDDWDDEDEEDMDDSAF